MKMLEGKPVIISSSITGLLISLSLSKRGIKHILIGGEEPDENPRLGESMNEATSLDFWRFLDPELRKHFYTKSHISLLNGKLATMAFIADPNRSLDKISSKGKKASLSPTRSSLIHVDRLTLDKCIYREVKTSKYCIFIHHTNTDLIYDKGSDKITAIRLANDHKINHPTYVFDATGARGLVAQAANVGKTIISDRQRVVWTHYWREHVPRAPKVWWLYGTNLLRLEKNIDNVDGISWLIPLGDTVSAGVSVDATIYNRAKISKQSLMKALDQAFERRGIDYRSLFPKTKSIMELNHEYFIRDRAYGKNWLLAGGGYIQIWFPSSAGLWTSMVAAYLAPTLLQDSERVGKYYECTLKSLLSFHDHINSMIKAEPYESYYQAYTFWSRWLAFIPGRLSRHLKIYNHDLYATTFKYRLSEYFSKLCLNHYIIQLLIWGFFITRIKKSSKISRQGKSFGGYFNFMFNIIRNYSLAWPSFFWSLLFVRK